MTQFQIWYHDIFKKYPKINVLFTCSNCFIANMTSEKSKIKRLSNLLSNICEAKIKPIYKSTQQSFSPSPSVIPKGRQAHHKPASLHPQVWPALRNPEAEHGILVTTADPKAAWLLPCYNRKTSGFHGNSVFYFQHALKPTTMQTADTTLLSILWGPFLLAG